MNKKEFDQSRVKKQLDFIEKSIEQENSALLNMGSLAIALIVILSLNKELIIFKPTESKILLTLFLSLTIIILLTHAFFLERSKKRSSDIIDAIFKEYGSLYTVANMIGEIKMDWYEKVTKYVPKVVRAAFSLCLFYIICVLWR